MKRRILLLVFILMVFAIIPVVNADQETITSSYNGDYSIDYLVRNYNAITFGVKNNNLDPNVESLFEGLNNGDIDSPAYIQGPVLVAGDFKSDVETGFAYDNPNWESYIKGNLSTNIETNSKIVTNDDYVNFGRMYAQVVNEQQMLVEQADKIINDNSIYVESPGIYTIENTNITNDFLEMRNTNISDYDERFTLSKKLFITNYDPNQYYIFNVLNTYVYFNYQVYVMTSDDQSFITYNELIDRNEYSGNIIFSYPNAKYINLSMSTGKIIAPKADIYLIDYYFDCAEHDRTNGCTSGIGFYYDSVFANSIRGYNTKLFYYPYTGSKRILNSSGKQYVEEYQDFSDDIYSDDYSILSLLKNYNIVSLGMKNYDSKSPFYNNDSARGSVGIFHIAGPFLVNGNLVATSDNYPVTTGDDNEFSGAIRLDKESNNGTSSYVNGFIEPFETKYWTFNNGEGEDIPIHGSINLLYINPNYNNEYAYNLMYNQYAKYGFSGDSDYNLGCYYFTSGKFYNCMYGYTQAEQLLGYEFKPAYTDYINFDRLYSNIVEQQSAIKLGKEASIQDGIAHVKTGKNNVISDINSINEIVIDDFANNKDELTIITIMNSGDVNFPVIKGDSTGLITTNDYYGKEEATYEYEYNTFHDDYYHGNIIWNVPNATYIKLAENAPFAGHLVAPKADVYTTETHFSGSFIVNSLYTEGNTEAHFYPVTANEIEETYYDESRRIVSLRMSADKALGSENSIVDKAVVGDYQSYLKDQEEKNSIAKVLVNPSTFRISIVFFILLISVMIGLTVNQKNKLIKQKN